MNEDEIIDVPFSEDEIFGSEAVYRTYRMDFEKKRIIGMVDGIDAAAQSIIKELQTKRYAYLIYDDQYGCELLDKIGIYSLSDDYLSSDIPAMIEDALIVDDMVAGLGDVEYEFMNDERDGVNLTVYVQTIFGDLTIEGGACGWLGT